MVHSLNENPFRKDYWKYTNENKTHIAPCEQHEADFLRILPLNAKYNTSSYQFDMVQEPTGAVDPWEAVNLMQAMNLAQRLGYEKARRDIRHALGVPSI